MPLWDLFCLHLTKQGWREITRASVFADLQRSHSGYNAAQVFEIAADECRSADFPASSAEPRQFCSREAEAAEIFFSTPPRLRLAKAK